MKRKVSHVFVLIFAVQLLTACCDDETIEITITGMESRALTLDGFRFVEIDNQTPINKEDLILEVLFTQVQGVASCACHQKQVLTAAVVPSCDPEIVYTQSIETFTVALLDVDNNNARIDITDRVVIEGTQLSVFDFIANSSPAIENLLLELSDTNNLPNRVTYVVEASLSDGTEISTTGGIIQFN